MRGFTSFAIAVLIFYALRKNGIEIEACLLAGLFSWVLFRAALEVV